MLEPVAHDQSALTICFVSRLNGHYNLAIEMIRIAANNVSIRLVQHIFVGGLLNRFTGIFCELRLHIKALQVTYASAHEYPDDRLRLRREVRPAAGAASGTPNGRRIGASGSISP